MNDDIKSANEGHLLLFRDYIGDKSNNRKTAEIVIIGTFTDGGLYF